MTIAIGHDFLNQFRGALCTLDQKSSVSQVHSIDFPWTAKK